MDVVFERCAGMDVQKRTVVVCRLTPDAEGQLVAQTHTCGTTTGDLRHLSDWLADGGCTHGGLARKHGRVLEAGLSPARRHVHGLAAECAA